MKKTTDYVIDLGPEGGHKGGEVLAHGTPEEVAAVEASFTGQFFEGIPYLTANLVIRNWNNVACFTQSRNCMNFLRETMKNVLIIALLLILILFSLNGFAQDYMKWGLPEHAILRLGKGQIYDLKHSPNGNLIAVATSIGVWIYDAHSGKEIRLLQKHGYEVHSVAFSPNSKMLASSGSDGIHLWDPYTGQHLSTF